MKSVHLVRKARVTARKRAANRANARKSTGPRTEQGKRRSCLNALKHGVYAERFRGALKALGEDPREFDRLRRDFIHSLHPATPFEAALVDDLAHLWWRKARVERGELGRQAKDVDQEMCQRERELNEANGLGGNMTPEELAEQGLMRMKDSAGKFEEASHVLEMLLSQVERGRDAPDAEVAMEFLYGRHPTWRAHLIVSLIEHLREAEEDAVPEGEAAKGEGTEPQGEAHDVSAPGEGDTDEPTPRQRRALLVHYLLAEIVEVTRQHGWFLQQYTEFSPAARDAALAPTGAHWAGILRYEESLGKQIDRKLRQLEKLQSAHGWGRRLRRLSGCLSPQEGMRSGPQRGGITGVPPIKQGQDARAPSGTAIPATRSRACSRNLEAGCDEVKSAGTKPRSSWRQRLGAAQRSQNEPATKPQRTGPRGERTRENPPVRGGRGLKVT